MCVGLAQRQAGSFSPASALGPENVLLTGGLGLLGSVILERLLRLTQVIAVCAIVRCAA
jgi:Male sterility protein